MAISRTAQVSVINYNVAVSRVIDAQTIAVLTPGEAGIPDGDIIFIRVIHQNARVPLHPGIDRDLIQLQGIAFRAGGPLQGFRILLVAERHVVLNLHHGVRLVGKQGKRYGRGHVQFLEMFHCRYPVPDRGGLAGLVGASP